MKKQLSWYLQLIKDDKLLTSMIPIQLRNLPAQPWESSKAKYTEGNGWRHEITLELEHYLEFDDTIAHLILQSDDGEIWEEFKLYDVKTKTTNNFEYSVTLEYGYVTYLLHKRFL